jgi:hypothetical protein
MTTRGGPHSIRDRSTVRAHSTAGEGAAAVRVRRVLAGQAAQQP